MNLCSAYEEPISTVALEQAKVTNWLNIRFGSYLEPAIVSMPTRNTSSVRTQITRFTSHSYMSPDQDALFQIEYLCIPFQHLLRPYYA